jgi:hypothetical protein
MIVYVSFEVRMRGLWLEDDAGEIEALRLKLLELARGLHAERVKAGYAPKEDDVQVDRLESIGGLGEEHGEGTAPGAMPP